MTDLGWVLLTTPPEPAVGCVVELRHGPSPDSWSRFVSVDDHRTPEPDRARRRWAPDHMPDAQYIDRAPWSALCKAAVAAGGQLVLVDAGPLHVPSEAV